MPAPAILGTLRRWARGFVYLVRDTFTDVDGTALGLHIPDLGPSWSVSAASTVQSNQAKATAANALCVIESGASDGFVETTWAAGGTIGAVGSRLVVRFVSTGNYWHVRCGPNGVTLTLTELVAGVPTQRGQTFVTLQPGGALIGKCNGTALSFYMRDPAGVHTALMSVTSTTHQTATQHGFQMHPTAPVEEFNVYPISTTGPTPPGL